MRHCSTNSPQAAARMAELALVAGGHIADVESVVLVNAVARWGPHRQMLDSLAAR